MQFHGPDKWELQKVVVTKICFYGKAKQKIKVGATKIQPDGPDKQESRKCGYH